VIALCVDRHRSSSADRRPLLYYEDRATNYTRGISICNNAIATQLGIISGHHTIYLFENVFESIFELGFLIELIDYSKQMAEVRDRVIAERPDPTATWYLSLYDREHQILSAVFQYKY
jgi:hypothetical protein